MHHRKLKAGMLALLLASLAACASESADSGSDTPDENDIATYQELALHVGERAKTYDTAMQAPNTTPADCATIHAAYDDQVRPWITGLVSRSDEMDTFMQHHEGEPSADIGCLAATMSYELEHHNSLACKQSDLAGNRAEAARHADAMQSYANRLGQRCNEMMHGLQNGGWQWGPMHPGCMQWNGHCSGMMEHCDDDGGHSGDGGMHGGGYGGYMHDDAQHQGGMHGR